MGATDVATGVSHARRLALSGFRESRGIALPYYYSHRVFGEFLSEKDLNKVAAARLLRRIRDETPFSEELLDGFSVGRSAADLAPWAESQNNCSAAQRHFAHRLAAEASRLKSLRGRRRSDAVRDMLEEADVNATYLKEKLKDVGRLAPVASWLKLFDDF